MLRNLQLTRLYLVLLAVFVAGRWILGVSGLPYERGNPIFSIVPMTLISSFFYGAFIRRWAKAGVGRAVILGLLIGLLGQLAILLATALSYKLNVDTYFNHRIALNAEKIERAIGFSEAMTRRFTGLIVNCVLNMVSGAIGWLLGASLPEKP
jgi:hypothetical protein